MCERMRIVLRGPASVRSRLRSDASADGRRHHAGLFPESEPDSESPDDRRDRGERRRFIRVKQENTPIAGQVRTER